MASSKRRGARKVAFVTGASRGIGKACALYLAHAGYDVAISARTVSEGEAREHSSTVKRSNTNPLPGSLESTAANIATAGREVMVAPADLLDYASLAVAITRVIERWGGIDVLVNNGRYIGPGHMDLLLDTPIELLEKHLVANVLAPVLLTKLALPSMIERKDGRIINITSASGYGDPTAKAGDGGWGMGYGISKGAFQRVAGFLDVEHHADGVYAFNVHPGYIATERIKADMGEFGFPEDGAPPTSSGRSVRGSPPRQLPLSRLSAVRRLKRSSSATNVACSPVGKDHYPTPVRSATTRRATTWPSWRPHSTRRTRCVGRRIRVGAHYVGKAQLLPCSSARVTPETQPGIRRDAGRCRARR